MPKDKGKLPKILSVDFTGVESGGGRSAYVPEGDYLTQVVDVRRKPKKDDPSRHYLNWKLKILEPKKYAGKILYHITALGEESLWSLRNFLVDLLGEDNVPQKKVDIPLASIVKKQPKIGITTEDDEYQGKKKSNVAGTFSKADWTELSKKTDDEDEEEDEEEETEDEEDEDEEEEEEEEEEKPAKKAKKVKKEKKAKKKPELDDDDEEDDMDEIDTEDI